MAAIDRVVFALNGQRYEVGGVDPSTRLLEFIRTQTPFTGPKLGCGEGMGASIFYNDHHQ
jgi:xanthine dehydrogenase iron-sulfur cluster and FAD-binding subunit A